MEKADQLRTYQQKRDFSVTSEPQEGGKKNESNRAFVIQKHWATRLHYDLRLELNGTMKSWAVPKGPSLDPHDKRMVIHVEDHPISYNTFEGIIPAKQYGAGKVIIWDKGTWHPLGDPYEGYKQGNLKFELSGQKLHGRWVLVRMKGNGEKQEPWLLIKEKDEIARPSEEFNVVEALPDSVANIKSAPAKKSLQKKTSAKLKAVKSGQSKFPAGAIKARLPVTCNLQASISHAIG